MNGGEFIPFVPGVLARLAEPPRKVVVVRASRIGDFVCATPAFRALRAALPAAEITFVGQPFVRELVARSPSLDRFEEFPGFPGIAEQFFDARRTTAFFARMQAERFDLAIQLHGSGVNANPFTLLLGAKATAGYVRDGDGAGRLDAALPWPRGLHEVRRGLALMKFLGAEPQGEGLDFPLWPDDRARAAEWLRDAEPPLFGLHPSARDRVKLWEPNRFVAVAQELRRRYGGTVVLLGGPDERALAETLARELGGRCLDLTGLLALPVLGAVMERLSVLMTNDSGPAHISYALGTPTVTIFGGTDPAVWGPPADGRYRVLAKDVACRPCELAACPIGYPCLEGVRVSEVVEAASLCRR